MEMKKKADIRVLIERGMGAIHHPALMTYYAHLHICLRGNINSFMRNVGNL